MAKEIKKQAEEATKVIDMQAKRKCCLWVKSTSS